MVAVRIGPDWRLVAVGAPQYFAARGVPQTLQDLTQHNCIGLRLTTAGGLYAWEFHKDGRDIRMRVDGQLTFNSTLPIVEAAVAGYGIAYVPEDIVVEHIASARPGGSIGFVGVPHGVELDGQQLFFAQKNLLGGPAPVRRFLPDLIDLVMTRKINPGKVFDLELPLQDVAEGYRAMDERRAIKTLLRV